MEDSGKAMLMVRIGEWVNVFWYRLSRVIPDKGL